MNFEEFKEQLMEDLKAYLPAEIGTGVEVEANEVHKVQQEGYEGIVVKKENNPVGVNMDIKMLKIMHRAELAHPTLSLKVNQVIAMVAQGMADGLLISNMRCLTNDEEEAGRWIGAFSKAGGAIYSVDEGKLEYHFKGDKPNPNK